MNYSPKEKCVEYVHGVVDRVHIAVPRVHDTLFK
jgi:hypothetical protein